MISTLISEFSKRRARHRCQIICARGAGASGKATKAKLFSMSSGTALKFKTTDEKKKKNSFSSECVLVSQF